jgi:hypothetical protein
VLDRRFQRINGSHGGPTGLRITFSHRSVYTPVWCSPRRQAKNFLIKVCYLCTLTQRDFSPGQSGCEFPNTPECI